MTFNHAIDLLAAFRFEHSRIERPPGVQDFIDFLFRQPECIMLHCPHGSTLEDALKLFIAECV